MSEIYYQGKPVERGFTGTMRTIVMQCNNPDKLDMRYWTNREFVDETRAFMRSFKPIGDIKPQSECQESRASTKPLPKT